MMKRLCGGFASALSEGWLGCVIAPLVLSFVAVDAQASGDELPAPEHWAEQRTLYQQAAAELDSGAGNRYQEMRDDLAGYPLRVDLDFSVKLGQLHDMTAEQARLFLAEADGTPLAGRFLVAFLRHKAQDRRWRSFLAVLDAVPESPELQCYYYRALRATGDTAAAFEGAAALWNVGYSQDDACDPLFDSWVRSGGPDDEQIWSRALLAFKAKNGHLIRYVKRFASPELQRDLDELAAIYRRPARIEGDHHKTTERHADIVVAGLVRLAQLNPNRAYQAMNSVRGGYAGSTERAQIVNRAIVRHSLFAERASAPEVWVTSQIAALKDDELTVIWLRNAIASSDWPSVVSGISWLSPERRAEDRWRYWWARAHEAQGQGDMQSLWSQLAESRSFHGFLAADRLGRPYAMSASSDAIPPPATDAKMNLGVGRVQELLALGDGRQAKEQWRHTLNQLPAQQRASLGDLALRKGWPDMATDAANAGRAWNRLDLRFPKIYWELFERAAKAVEQDVYDLIAIARRESGLWGQAQSAVGARGLMQIMPATARSVAQNEDIQYQGASSLFEVELNIQLGAAYYSQLVARYEGNRVKALAAYNAGPTRVDRWADGTRAVDQWVDSIPYAETREYVQAVLAYAVIYQTLDGRAATLLAEAERVAEF